MISIDGSRGEGGGSILRLGVAFSILKDDPIRIFNIRKGRKVPGLRTQHLIGLEALSSLCGGDLRGGKVGSNEIEFHPGNEWKTTISLKINTAGSIGLVAQALQIAVLRKKDFTLNVDFHGGATFGKWAPSLPWLESATWAIFNEIGYNIDSTINKHGFYPRGGARVALKFHIGNSIRPLNLTEFNLPKIISINSISTKSLERARVAERQFKSAQKVLSTLNCDILRKISYVKADCPGSGIIISSKEINRIGFGTDFIGERKISAEKVGKICANSFIDLISSKATVDPLCADQLLPILALAENESTFLTSKITNHTKTNIDLIKEFLECDIIYEKIDDLYLVKVNPYRY